MKKIILIISVLILVPLHHNAQLARFSVVSKLKILEAEIRKKNKVSKITNIVYPDSTSYLENKNGDIENIREYDLNGDMIKWYEKTEDKQSLYLSARYEYDESHRPIKIILLEENDEFQDSLIATYKDGLIYKEERFQNYVSSDYVLQQYENGKLLYEIEKKNEITMDSSHFFYNELGQQSLKENYFKGKLNYTIEYEYLTQKDYIERIYEINGSLRLKRYWKYDNFGHLLDRVEFNSDEKITTWYAYQYDSNGNVIMDGVFKGPQKKLSFKSEYLYEKNQLKQIILFDDGNIISGKYFYKYYKNGLEKLEIYHPGDTEKSSKSEYRFSKIEYRN